MLKQKGGAGEELCILKKNYYDNGSIKQVVKYGAPNQGCFNNTANIVKYYQGKSRQKPGQIKSEEWHCLQVKVLTKKYDRSGNLKDPDKFEQNKEDGSGYDLVYSQRYSAADNKSLKDRLRGRSKIQSIKFKTWLKDGVAVSRRGYWKNGSLKNEIRFKNGQIHSDSGPALVEYYEGEPNEPGIVKTEEWYKGGFCYHKKDYYDNGSLEHETKYNKKGDFSCRAGPAWVAYHIGQSRNQPGLVNFKAWFKAGFLTLLQEYAEGGNLKQEHLYLGGGLSCNEDEAYFWHRGIGVRKPDWQLFEIWKQNLFDDSQTDGYVFKTYYDNGSIKQETRYNENDDICSDGNPAVISYYKGCSSDKPGLIKLKIWFENDKEKTRRRYYENGSLMEVRHSSRDGGLNSDTDPALVRYQLGDGLDKLGAIKFKINCRDEADVQIYPYPLF